MRGLAEVSRTSWEFVTTLDAGMEVQRNRSGTGGPPAAFTGINSGGACKMRHDLWLKEPHLKPAGASISLPNRLADERGLPFISAERGCDWSYWQTKLRASSVFPCPLYWACLG